MPKTKTIVVSPSVLKLWDENPRFIAPPSEDTQVAIREHLLNTSEVIELAQMIVDYGGILPGERAVVTPHEGGYLVLEGNRRICAFQLLLDPTLIADPYKTAFPHATKSVIDDIEEIEVDIIPSIDEAISFLAARHITSVKKWPPLAKQQFLARAHKKYPKLKDLIKATHMEAKEIRQDLMDFYPLEYALNLPDWSSEERAKLDWTVLKVDRFQRILRIKDARTKLGISFTPDLNMVISLPKATFDKAMRLIARAAFITDAIDTRTDSLSAVPGLEELLKQDKPNSTGKDGATGTAQPDKPTPATGPTTTGKDAQEKPTQQPPSPPTPSTGNNPQSQGPSTTPNPNPPAFFEHLNLTISPTDPDGTGILALAVELKDINYKKYPIATAMLMRAILEQALKYRIKKAGQWPTLLTTLRNKKDPGISELLNYLKNNMTSLLSDKNTHRIVNTLFSTPGIKDYFDLIVHQTDVTKATWVVLQAIAKSGFVGLIEQLTQ